MTELRPPITSTSPRDAAATSTAKRIALVAMLFAVSMTFIDQTIVAIASPTIQSELSLSRVGTQWVVNAYLLALAAVFALGGRLADVLGSRRMAVVGIVGFAACSALCGATPTGSLAETWIVTCRALQGAFGAIMIPAALAVVVAAFPLHERGRALAIFFGVSGAMTAIGPVAGGYLTQWTWRSIFWINVPIAAISLALALKADIGSPSRPDRIDVRGALLVALGMTLSVLGLQQAQMWGWASPLTWLCLVGGVAVLGIFVRVQLRTTSPLLRLSIFADRAFVVDNAVLFLSMIAFVPAFFFASVYSQVSLGYDADRSGLYLLMIFAGFGPAAQIGGRMLDRGGPRRPMVLGSALSCVGFALWALHTDQLSLAKQWPFIVMAGAGLGLLVGPASTDAVNRAIGASYGEVTGITQTVRNYGSSLGLAVLGSVLSMTFARQLQSTLHDVGVPGSTASTIAQQVARGDRSGAGLSTAPARVARQVESALAGDFATATHAVLMGMAIVLGLCFLVAVRYPRRDTPTQDAEAAPVPRA